MVEFPGTEADQPLKPPPEPSPGQSVQHQFGWLVCMTSKSSQMIVELKVRLRGTTFPRVDRNRIESSRKTKSGIVYLLQSPC